MQGDIMRNLSLLKKAINSGCKSVADFAIFLEEQSKLEDRNSDKKYISSLPTLYKRKETATNLNNNIFHSHKN